MNEDGVPLADLKAKQEDVKHLDNVYLESKDQSLKVPINNHVRSSSNSKRSSQSINKEDLIEDIEDEIQEQIDAQLEPGKKPMFESESLHSENHINKSNAVTINSKTNMLNENKHDDKRDSNQKMKRAVFNLKLANTVLRKNKKNYIQQNEVFPLLYSALAIPGYHFNFYHGREPPAIIFEALKIAITDSTTDTDGDGIKDTSQLFRIELQYGPIRWVIYRKLIEFYELRAYLNKRYYSGKVQEIAKFPSILSYTFQKAFSRNNEHSAQIALERRKALEKYLKDTIKLLNMQCVKELFEFFEMSGCSFRQFMGWKGKEGYLRLRNTKTKNVACFPRIFNRWNYLWVIVRDSYIMMCKSIYDDEPNDIILFNCNTKLDLTCLNSLNPLEHRKIGIYDYRNRLDLKAESSFDIKFWINHIQLSLKKSCFTKQHRYDSFAPIRDNINLKWYVDAAGYFYDVSEAILHAKDTIYIADWWLSPEVYLRRPPSQYPSFRLDRLLKKKALQGVDVYIIVYKEIALSLPNNSAHTKQSLKTLHHRIKVLRHPDRVQTNGTWFWAHHEKICVIDNKIGFVGGLDLCFGRYDDNSHRIADYNPLSDGKDIIFPGQDYSNARIKDFENVQDYNRELIDRMKHGRMPWHDIHLSLTGVAARDVARHFIQRWNFIKNSKAKQKVKIPYLIPKAEQSKDYNEEALKGNCKVQVLRSSSEWSSGIELEHSIYTAYIKNIEKSQYFIYIENQFFVSAAKGDSTYQVKNQIAKALVDRIIKAHKQKSPFRVIVIMPLMPAFQSDVHEANANTIRLVMQWQYQSICRGEESIFAQLKKNDINPDDYIYFHGLRNYDFIPLSHHFKPEIEQDEQGHQTPKVHDKFEVNSPVDHSMCDYFDSKDEKNINPNHSKDNNNNKQHNQHIKQRNKHQQHNKFNKNNKKIVTKHLKQHLKRNENSFKNIMEAFKEKEIEVCSSDEEDSKNNTNENNNTKTIEVDENDLPSYVKLRNQLTPNVPTTIIPADQRHVDFIHNNEVRSIKSDKSKEIKVDESKEQNNISKPIKIDIQNINKPMEAENTEAASQYVTELVYIHSKLMIVDDRIVICGSANINDRSMVGYRDSEIAIIVEDQEMLDSTMAGKKFQVAKFAHSLRCTVFKEHLGLLSGTEMVNLINFEAGENLLSPPSPLSPLSPLSPNLSVRSDKSFHPDEVIQDPLSSDFNQYWLNVSNNNTKVFRKVFRCVPDDTVTNWEEYKQFIPNSTIVQTGHPDFRTIQPSLVKKTLDMVRGHLVDFPTKFLENESLEAGAFSAENIIPIDVFI